MREIEIQIKFKEFMTIEGFASLLLFVLLKYYPLEFYMQTTDILIRYHDECVLCSGTLWELGVDIHKVTSLEEYLK